MLRQSEPNDMLFQKKILTNGGQKVVLCMLMDMFPILCRLPV